MAASHVKMELIVTNVGLNIFYLIKNAIIIKFALILAKS